LNAPQKSALVVDDSQTARVILQQMLSKHELHVVSVACAEEALEHLRHHQPDVIFMDHMLPGMDGLQALKAIKADPRSATIPVLMYTARLGDGYAEQARAQGAIGILSKQLRRAELYQVLLGLGLVADRRLEDDDLDLPEPGPTQSEEGGWRSWMVTAAVVLILSTVIVSGFTLYHSDASARPQAGEPAYDAAPTALARPGERP
jgi:CheY-like chemotaxis protein